MSSVNFLEKLLDGVEIECVSSKPLNTRNTRKHTPFVLFVVKKSGAIA